MIRITPFIVVIYVVIFAAPTIIGILFAIQNYLSSYNILSNIIKLDTLLIQNQSSINCFTLYAINNTGNIYIANIVKKEIRNPIKHEVIRVNKKIQSVVSINWTTIANLSNLNILLPTSLLEDKFECNTSELQKFGLEKHFMINSQVFQDPNDVFIIAYGEIPKEKYPVIYYYVENLDQNLAPNITYISNEPNEIITREYPVIEMILSGLLISLMMLHPISLSLF